MKVVFKTLAVISLMAFLNSCGNSGQSNNLPETDKSQVAITGSKEKTENALSFINAYVSDLSKIKKATELTDWVSSSAFVTQNFKTELKRVIDEAYKQDPELGLGSDPLLDAQDNPERGFELESFDEQTNYLVVKGKDWPEFKLTMHVAEEKGNWLVDGCGMINIPDDKRSKR